MSLTDLAAVILITNQKYTDPDKAKKAIRSTFKREFPYWSFGDWNVMVPAATRNRIFKLYKGNLAVTVRQLIIELPALVKENSN